MGVDPRLLESLAAWRDSRAVILGVGNVLRGDDAAGPLICERLAGRLAAAVFDAGAAPENYVGPILRAEPEVLLVIDAVDSGNSPGWIGVFAPADIHRFTFSTHALSLHLFLDRLRRDRPLEARLIGIQVGRRGLGEGVSPQVREAIGTVSDTLAALLPLSAG